MAKCLRPHVHGLQLAVQLLRGFEPALSESFIRFRLHNRCEGIELIGPVVVLRTARPSSVTSASGWRGLAALKKMKCEGGDVFCGADVLFKLAQQLAVRPIKPLLENTYARGSLLT